MNDLTSLMPNYKFGLTQGLGQFNSVYTLDFGIFVLDRIFVEDSLAHMSSVQENIHILGQLQDYLLQQNLDVNFQEVELTSSLADDYNITIAMSDFSISLARNPYIRTIDA